MRRHFNLIGFVLSAAFAMNVCMSMCVFAVMCAQESAQLACCCAPDPVAASIMAEEGDQGRRADGTWHQWAKSTWGSEEGKNAWWTSSAHEWYQENHAPCRWAKSRWGWAEAQGTSQSSRDDADGDRMVVDDGNLFAECPATQAPLTAKLAPCDVHGWLTSKQKAMYQDRKLLRRLLDRDLDGYDDSVVVGKLVSETAWTSAVASRNDVIYHIAMAEWESENPNVKKMLFWLLHNVTMWIVPTAVRPWWSAGSVRAY